MVCTLSGVLIVVPNKPMASTVPVTPPAVTDLEGSEKDEERAGREIREQSAPRHADGHTARGEQRRKRRRLDAKEPEDGDEEHDVENDREAVHYCFSWSEIGRAVSICEIARAVSWVRVLRRHRIAPDLVWRAVLGVAGEQVPYRVSLPFWWSVLEYVGSGC